MLELRNGQTLKIYSQEMFLSFLISGDDPFERGRSILEEFAEGHPALQYLSKLGFDWPTTFVTSSERSVDLSLDLPKNGVLGLLGYHVGQSGVPAKKRRLILSEVFNEGLPKSLPINGLEALGGNPNLLKD